MKETLIQAPGKAIGWFCSYVPEEVILAAGFESVRLRGRAGGVRHADVYVSSNLCPFPRSLVDCAASRGYEDLAAVVFASSCDGMRRVYDLWNEYVGAPRAFMLEVPKNRGEEAVAYFANRIADLGSRLGSHLGVPITDDALRDAIRRTNENRALVQQIFDGQKEVPARRRGSELLGLLAEETSRPKAETAHRMKEWIASQATPAHKPGEPRILVQGNRLETGVLLEMIEAAGGCAVVVDTCEGLAHYEELVDETAAPAEALARRYLLKPSCARMPGVEARLGCLERLIRDYEIDGVLSNSLKFCDHSLFETPQVAHFLESEEIPFLSLETDYTWGDTGRLRTRVEAFLEQTGTLAAEEGGTR